MHRHTTEVAVYGFGFPEHFCTHQITLADYADSNPPKVIPQAEILNIQEVYSRGRISIAAIFYDLLVGLVFVLTFAAPIEYVLRRREVRKP